MISIPDLFAAIVPVFAMIALGALMRHFDWLTESAEQGLFNLVVRATFPCLIFESVAGNKALHQPENLLFPPLAGFLLTLASMLTGWIVARGFGLKVGDGLRTFALSVGLTNYVYLPLPLMDAIFGPSSRAVLLVHNVGVEAAIWTGGVLMVTGLSPRQGWKHLVNPPIVSLIVAVFANLSGSTAMVPALAWNVIHLLAVCAVPLGLILTGVSFQPHLNDPRQLINVRIGVLATVLRLGMLPWFLLLAARFLPFSVELKHVLIVQAAMPAAVVSVIVARVYGGQPLVAVQVALGTTALAIFTIPYWIRFGLSFVGA